MDKIIKIFSNNIKDKLKNHIKSLYLYGFRARGDYNNRSDYDFLIKDYLFHLIKK